jgi:hypothetical protein
MAIPGLIGGPLIIVSGTAVLFGAFKAGSAPQAIATVPEFVWELSLGIYLMVKGIQALSDPVRHYRRCRSGRALPSLFSGCWVAPHGPVGPDSAGPADAQLYVDGRPGDLTTDSEADMRIAMARQQGQSPAGAAASS